MRWRYLAVVAGGVMLGALAGGAVGWSDRNCEYSCPAQGRCPVPPDCRGHTFDWPAALAIGIVVALLVIWLAWVHHRRTGRSAALPK